MNTVKTIPTPPKPSQSTFLVGDHLFKKYMEPRLLKGKRLTHYLSKLLEDPYLEYKLSLLKPKKWKKHYQDDGQNLSALYFYPDECDWARLSIISNATGFSRCYIFVYLMLFDLGVLKLPKNITRGADIQEAGLPMLFGKVFMDERAQILKRTIQT
jgi:hypothetical protein